VKCPNCRLENPPDALRCDCAYDFPSGTQKASYLTAKDKELSEPLYQKKKKPQWIRYLGFASLGLLAVSAVVRIVNQDAGTALALPGTIIGVCWIVASLIWSAFSGLKSH
jgi:cell division protein FtsW (lipid II flippase)